MTIWQGLGSFVYTGENLGEDKVQRFAEIGGSWVIPVLYGDDAAGPWNLANLGGVLKPMCARHGVKVGGWFNGWGGDPVVDADNVAAIVKAYKLDPVVLDLEAAYQKNPDVFPQLLKDMRVRLPQASLGVSTNSLNDSLIWNGRGLTPRESARRLGYRVLPQWYNSPNYLGPWADPAQNMAWLWANGTKDNFFDPSYANQRAVPLSYVHGTAETTGLEGADLSQSLPRFAAAKAYGLTPGMSTYLLEVQPDGDFDLLQQHRGTLYL